MSKLFSDPEIDKLIIYALLGVIAVLLIAVLFLAVKKNIYYVNDEGEEIAPMKKPRRKNSEEEEYVEEEEEEEPEQEEVPAVPEPVPVQKARPTIKPILADKEIEEPVKTKEVPSNVRQENAAGLALTVSMKDNEYSQEVTSFPCILGRESTADVVVSEPAVSRKHARILNLDGILYIEDIAGHNGTYLNGRKLAGKEQARLQAGDRVNIGRSQITIREILY